MGLWENQFFFLTYSDIGIYTFPMARAATTSDAFNAIAEPRRTAILEHLARKECAVGDIAKALGIAQPSVSKHLRVLDEVGLVDIRRDGRRRFYRTKGERLKSIHDWTKTFERYWQHQLERMKVRAEERASTDAKKIDQD